jgi:hypothetical protein
MERSRFIRPHLQLHDRTMRGRVGSVAWKLPDNLSKDEWIEAGVILARIGAGMMWWVGDYWITAKKLTAVARRLSMAQIGRGHPFRPALMLLQFVEHSKLPVGGKI